MEDTVGCGNTSHCPNQFCAPGAAAVDQPTPNTEVHEQAPEVTAQYTTLVWVYEWPSGSEEQHVSAESDSEALEALAIVARLGASGLLSADDEDTLVDALLAGDTSLAALVRAYGEGEEGRAARQLQRWVASQ